jgi:hypothetical protein
MSLEEIAVEANVSKYCDKCEKWMEDLFQAFPKDLEACYSVMDTILNECRELEEEMSSLSPPILRLLSTQLANKFAKEICTIYDRRISFCYDELVSLCCVVFRSVLTRFVIKIDIEITYSRIGQILLIESLDCVPGLLELRLGATSFGDSPQVTSEIHHVKYLQIFQQHYYCTDEIVLQLRLHCPHLTELDITYSSDVTNASVEYLMHLRKLKYLHLRGTEIDFEHYGLLLSEFPDIANIEQWAGKGDILRLIPAERFDKITHVMGHFRDIDTLRLKCPNTTNITLRKYFSDLSGLAAFLALHVLEISSLDYDTCNLNAVLRGIGHRLTSLKMESVASVNIPSIISLCISLETFSLSKCSLSPLMADPPFDPKMPHFRNLFHLQISSFFEGPTNFSFIRYYESLKTICITYLNIFTVEFVREILALGTFTQLKVLILRESFPGSLTMEGLQLLLQHCPHLKRISLGSNSLLRPSDLAKLNFYC